MPELLSANREIPINALGSMDYPDVAVTDPIRDAIREVAANARKLGLDPDWRSIHIETIVNDIDREFNPTKVTVHVVMLAERGE